MAMGKRVLAFDFGASSGRAVLCSIENGQISLNEVHRFPNDPVKMGDRLYWDFVRLFHEIKQGISKAVKAGGFDSIGIDTWGVDFGLLDSHGRLMSNPVHYRDERTTGIPEKVFKKISKEDIYKRTGIQFMRINTLYQLAYLAEFESDTLHNADCLLFIPDLMAYYLTGKKRAEYTICSTSNLLNCKTGVWDGEILDTLEIPAKLFPQMIHPGDTYGKLSEEICAETGCEAVPVIAVASHDTASAVVAVPADPVSDHKEPAAYISCGTWSLLGTELNKPIADAASSLANFTNEGGVNGTIRYIKNIMGLWLAQQCRAWWMKEGLDASYQTLDKETADAKPFMSFIDPDDEMFEAPGDMPQRIREYCSRTGQPVPASKGEILRCIYQSLAIKYRLSLKKMEELTGCNYPYLHMIGGGIKDHLLCQMTADACGIPVKAGPVEATATGNAIIQLIVMKEIESIKQARQMLSYDKDMKIYNPQNAELWDGKAEYYKHLIG